MLENNQKIILYFLVNECGESYKIIEIEDIEDYLRDLKKRINIISTLKRLQDRGYISIKYFDENKYCLCVLPLGRQVYDNERAELNNKRLIKFETALVIFLIFIFAFLGSFLGTILVGLF